MTPPDRRLVRAGLIRLQYPNITIRAGLSVSLDAAA